jgi:hypothetical protein
MASESTLVPTDRDRAIADKSEPSKPSKRLQSGERRVPTARETLRTLPEPLSTPAESELDFEPHDTIPAPPWLDDDNVTEPPHKSS